MKHFKKIACFLMAAAMCFSLTACMNADAPQSTTRTEAVPEASVAPSATNGAAVTQQPVAFDWLTGSGTVEANVNRISEIADSRVVVTGTTALVGVKFTSAYQGEMTERIREMVAAEVMEADPSIQTVAVTAEGEDVDRVFEISDCLRAGEDANALSADINEIVRNATTLR